MGAALVAASASRKDLLLRNLAVHCRWPPRNLLFWGILALSLAVFDHFRDLLCASWALGGPFLIPTGVL